jgi:membrane-bound inhibitor of C-type lysozyme
MTATRLFVLAILGGGLTAACSREQAPARAPAKESAALAPASPVAADPKLTTYACEDGRTVRAGYPDRETAVLTVGGHTYTLKIAISASGARYTGYGRQWWTKGLDEGRLAPLKSGEDVASAAGVQCRRAEVEPPAPGTPGGLPDDRTPVSEAPFAPTSAQGAANVVQTYFALLEQGKAAEAARLRVDGRPEDLSPYASYHAQVGAPGHSEGAAGSLYIEVPVVIYGRLKTGGELHRAGKAVLRRANDVPGSTADERRWRIDRLEVSDSPR